MLHQARVLISGGLGFIGSHLARRLVSQGAEVLIVDSLIPEYGGNLFNIADIQDRVRVNIADIRDPHSMRYLIQGQDFIFNLAGQTSHMDSMRDPHTDLAINCAAQLYLLEACRLYNPTVKIIFASTRQVYGRPRYLPVDEEHPLQPVDINGIHKLAGEQYHQVYRTVHGLQTSILRLTNTYGPAMRVKDSRQTFLGIWIRRLVEGQPFEVWGGEQLRDLCYVDDAVSALCQVALEPACLGRALNVPGCDPIRLVDLAEKMAALCPGSFQVIPFPEAHARIDIGDYYCTGSALRALAGWQPLVSLDEGLQRTLDYFRQHLERYR